MKKVELVWIRNWLDIKREELKIIFNFLIGVIGGIMECVLK